MLFFSYLSLLTPQQTMLMGTIRKSGQKVLVINHNVYFDVITTGFNCGQAQSDCGTIT